MGPISGGMRIRLSKTLEMLGRYQSKWDPKDILWSGRLTASYLFEKNIGQVIIDNDKQYTTMITNIFWSELADMNLKLPWSSR